MGQGPNKNPSRNHALDGLRGLLACTVLAHHALPLGAPGVAAGELSVFGFFVISGWVLTKSWDGNFAGFLVKRFLRLWPGYALSLATGYLLSGKRWVWSDLIWIPPHPMVINGPAWSLCVEAFAMLAMPLFVRSRSHPLWAAAACAALGLCGGRGILVGSFALMFVVGAWLSEFRFESRFLESEIPQYLGRISYPLYLFHWMAITYLSGPMWLRVLISFATAHLLTLTVERWSILASRRVGASVRWPGLGWKAIR
ncbi:MAG: acyltransferase [Burkholderiales bacterium]|nr:acyltransferase [Burkholderiales bacterium]MDE2453064.1 acyltransferase [Burkholderiales bacterium]